MEAPHSDSLNGLFGKAASRPRSLPYLCPFVFIRG